MASIQAPLPAEKPFTAVVVFHGMGQQRHYESVWRLIQALDAFVNRSVQRPGAPYVEGRLLLKTRRERLRDETGAGCQDEIVYTEAQHAVEPGARRVRFYEGYWAPATVGGTRALSVLLWLLVQIPRPLKVLAAPWRSYARLRRARLVSLVRDGGHGSASREGGEDGRDPARVLLQLYDRFCQRRPPAPGSFQDFLYFVRRSADSSEQRDALMATLWCWWRRHHGRLLHSAALLLLGALAIASLVGLLLLGSLELLRTLAGWNWATALVQTLGMKLEVNAGSAMSLLAAAAAMSGLTAFMKNVIGDVQQFVTYEETDVLHERRARLMAEARKTLRHVLADPLCERVLVFGHSLGSAVALDTLLALRAYNECAAPRRSAAEHMQGPVALHKVEHLVTCGSPIDKIGFFFATQSSHVAGFERMVDDLRGDIGDIPFSKPGRQPHVHWVNFWDRGDPISGPVNTVMPVVLRRQRVDNVRITSLAWPDIAASHESYFEHPAVLGHLYRALFQGTAGFATPPRTPPDAAHPRGRPIYAWLGPGSEDPLQSVLIWLLPAALLLVVAAAVCVLLQFQAALALQTLGLFTGVLLGGAALQRLLRARLLRRRRLPRH